MIDRTRQFLTFSFLIVATIFLSFYGMALAKAVLAPIFLAAILAMMLTPVANFLEKKGMKRGWSSLFSDLLILIFILGIFWSIGYEVEVITENWSAIESTLNSAFKKAENFIESNSGFTVDNPFSQSTAQEQAQSGTGSEASGSSAGNTKNGGESTTGQLPVRKWLTSILSNLFSYLSTILLILVYIFFMLLYRDKFEKAILMFISEENKEKGKIVLGDILKGAQEYLFGHVILIIILAIIYATGFSISGMQSPISTALLAALLSFIPYVGTIGGGLLALSMAFVTSNNTTSAVLIVLVTLTIAQFIESYFIEPYLIGKRVNVNPLFTIFSIIVGAAVWGVIGMIVFLPLFSFIKAVADHVPFLHPVGYAIGKEDASDGESSLSKLAKKIKERFK